MARTSTKTVSKTAVQNTSETDHDDGDIFEEGDYIALASGDEKDTIKRDARRKIEIYWEKKRLKELFDDFDESEFGF